MTEQSLDKPVQELSDGQLIRNIVNIAMDGHDGQKTFGARIILECMLDGRTSQQLAYQRSYELPYEDQFSELLTEFASRIESVPEESRNG